MSWIKFHKAITQGEKRAIPRSVRFIYLELSLLSRELNGYVQIPKSMDLIDAIHDAIGGQVGEIKDALKYLLNADDPMLELVERDGKKFIYITSFEAWNTLDVSAPRVRAFRERRKQDNVTQVKRVTVTDVTRYIGAEQIQPNTEQISSNLICEKNKFEQQESSNALDKANGECNGDVTRYSNASVTNVTATDQRREEKNKIPPLPPLLKISDEVGGEGKDGGGVILDCVANLPWLTDQDKRELSQAIQASQLDQRALTKKLIRLAETTEANDKIISHRGFFRMKSLELVSREASKKPKPFPKKPSLQADPQPILSKTDRQAMAPLVASAMANLPRPGFHAPTRRPIHDT